MVFRERDAFHSIFVDTSTVVTTAITYCIGGATVATTTYRLMAVRPLVASALAVCRPLSSAAPTNAALLYIYTVKCCTNECRFDSLSLSLSLSVSLCLSLSLSLSQAMFPRRLYHCSKVAQQFYCATLL